MATITNPLKGTDIKFNISLAVEGLTMDDFDFTIVFSADKGMQSISKSEMFRVDEDNYIALVNTDNIGKGRVKLVIKALIPDSEFNVTRREVVQVLTDTIIY